MRRLLVANIIEDGRWAGPQKRIAQVAKELRRHGVDTLVILPGSESARFQEELQRNGVTYVLVRIAALHRTFGAVLRFLVSFVPDVISLIRQLRSQPCELIHVSGGAWQIRGAFAGKLIGVPVVWHLNDSLMPRFVVRLFRLVASRLAVAFIVTADRSRRVYLDTPKLSRFQVFHIQAPVDTASLDPKKVLPDVRVLHYPGVRVLSVANVNPLKGLEYFIDAAKILLDDGGEYSFLVVGPVYETQRAYFESLTARIRHCGITERFHFLGAVSDVAPVLSAADIFVCSSIAESGPMTLWEAMAMERAVVSTDVGDVTRYVRSGENGYVVPTRDSQALADAIADLAGKPHLRRDFGRLAREVVSRELELGVIGERTADCYRKVLHLS